MRLVVTGANSFIGSRLVRAASYEGWEVVAVVRPGCPDIMRLDSMANVQVQELALEDYKTLGQVCRQVDTAVLLAWNGTRGSSRMDSERQKLNYIHNINAIQDLIDNGCKRIITAGSQAEYGEYTGPINEDMECHPNTEYGKWKYKFYTDASVLCKEAGISIKEPRYFSLYGPGDYENTLIMQMIRNMLTDQDCELTEGIQLWDYLHIDDAIQALMRLCYMECPDGVYNIGSGDTRVLKDYVEELREITGSRSRLLYGAIPYPATGMVSICPDVHKTMQELSWRPQISFRQGIISILESIGALRDEKN